MPLIYSVYTEGGRVVHRLPSLTTPNSYVSAECGVNPWPNWWRGSGTQATEAEREKKRKMPRCKRCWKDVGSGEGET